MTVSSIGSGMGRDYATIQDWIDACPADLVTGTDQWIGELYNDSEFSLSSTVTIYNITTNSTYYVELRAASGEEWTADSALKYNQSNGVAVTINSSDLFDIRGTDNVKFRNIQMKRASGSGGMIRTINTNIAETILFDSCLFQHNGTGGVVNTWGGLDWDFENCAFIWGGTYGIEYLDDNSHVYNCTFVRVGASPSGTAIRNPYGSATTTIIKNNAFFNLAAVVTNTSGCTGSNNASDLGSIGFGTSNQTGLTVTDEIYSITSGSEDLRSKASGNLPGNGVNIGSITDDFRSETRPTTPTIGCWEPDLTLAADPGTYTYTGITAQFYRSNVPADAGSYTLTGFDAGLAVNTVFAAKGTFTLTGNNSLLGIDNIAADVGAYTLGGQDANFVVKIITGGIGSYTLTGVAALPYVSKVATVTGSYVLTGKSAALPNSTDNPLWTQSIDRPNWTKNRTPAAKLTARFRKKF